MTIEREIWRPVVGADKGYEISNIIAGRSYETRGWTFKNAPVEEIERRPCVGGH